MSTGGAGSPQAGFLDFSRTIPAKKLSTAVIAKYDVLGLDSSNNVIVATTAEVERFCVAAEAKGNGDTTIMVFPPGEIAKVKVASGGAAAVQGPVKIGGTAGQVNDQGAATNANKVVGWCLGKDDPLNKTFLLVAGAAGDYIYLYIKPWTAVTTV